ncbi:MAG: HD domain-containing protein [bacterium]|nr:HD domain-containing protein [bacterium]
MDKDFKVQSFIDLFRSAGLLKTVKRTGWENYGISNPESIADHSFLLTFFAMILAERFGIDTYKCMRMALLHDLGESIVGDIIEERGEDRVFSEEEKIKKEGAAIEKILSGLAEKDEFVALWEEYAKGESQEARFVRQLDKLEMVLQALEYEKRDGKKLEEFWINAEKYITDDSLKSLFEELKSLRGR